MPRLSAEDLRSMCAASLRAVTVPEEDAELTARLMVEANLTGHDTHGVRQLARYVGLVNKGVIVAGAPLEVLRESPTTALLDAHFGLGHVAATRATERAIAMARETHLSAVGVRNLNHVGRVGAYPEMIAAAGLVGIVTVNAQARGVLVAPFGGLAARMGTNPFAAAFPSPSGPPILLDFATSAVAANKVKQAHSRGQPAEAGWLADHAGEPTLDPAEFIAGRAVLQPLGGGQGYKGYALAVLVDLLSGVLAGSGTAPSEQPHTDLNNGTFILCIDPEAFLERSDYEREVRTLVDYLHATPARPDRPPVQLPGEFEARNREQRSVHGIEIEPPVWADMCACAESVGVTPPEAME